jgi:dGTPase
MGFSDDKFELFNRLMEFNTRNIYNHPRILRYEAYCDGIISALFEHLLARCDQPHEPSDLPLDASFARYLERMSGAYRREGSGPRRWVTDYVAGMTDNFALDAMAQITLPEPIAFPGSRT